MIQEEHRIARRWTLRRVHITTLEDGEHITRFDPVRSDETLDDGAPTPWLFSGWRGSEELYGQLKLTPRGPTLSRRSSRA
jgi:hypothetical protein